MYITSLQAGLHSGFPPCHTRAWTPDVVSSPRFPGLPHCFGLRISRQYLVDAKAVYREANGAFRTFRHALIITLLHLSRRLKPLASSFLPPLKREGFQTSRRFL